MKTVPCLATVALVLAGLLALPGPSRGDEAASPEGAAPSPPEERFHLRSTGAEFTVLRDGENGAKRLVRGDGVRFRDVEEAVLAEEAAISPLRRRLAPSLWEVVEDPDRAGTMLRVVLVGVRQPLHGISVAQRRRAARDLAPLLRELRTLVAEGADGALPQGDADSPAARVAALREAITERAGTMRRDILAAAAPAVEGEQRAVIEAVLRVPGARVEVRSRMVNVVAITVPAGDLAGLLESLPAVALALPDGECGFTLDTSVPAVGATSWTGAGIDGGPSTRVAILDTGVDGSHPALVDAMAGAGGSFEEDPDDGHGHGTHVAGIVASRDATYGGVAPGARLLNGKISEGALFFLSSSLPAAEWAAGEGAAVFNLSWGVHVPSLDGIDAGTLFYDALADDLSVAVAAGAGNSGSSADALLSPSSGFNVLSVANHLHAGTVTRTDDVLNVSSSRGPVADGRRKPDLAAPGTAIRSCNNAWEGDAGDWTTRTGTSMATPHVSGALALLVDAGTSWRPEAFRAILLATTDSSGTGSPAHDAGWGWGALDLAAAYASRTAVLEGTFEDGGATETWLRVPALPAGGRVALCWNRQVFFDGSGGSSLYRPLVDLDLEVYGDDGSPRGTSTSMLDPVERVGVASATAGTVVRVLRAGAFPSGQSSVDWAVAGGGAGIIEAFVAEPPSLRCVVEVPSTPVRLREPFVVEARLVHDGGMAAHVPGITLVLPPGLEPVDGSPTRAVATLREGGESGTVSWTVRAVPGADAEETLTVGATSLSFGALHSSPAAEATVVVDRDSPWVLATLADGAPAVRDPSVILAVEAHGGADPVVEMRVRDAGSPWGDWMPAAENLDIVLPAGRGLRTVEVQVRDGAGRESATATATTFLDGEPPVAAFRWDGDADVRVSGDLPALVPEFDDGEGSGVADWRFRWRGGEWGPWTLLADGTGARAVPPPPTEGVVYGEVVVRDLAGNESEIASRCLRTLPAASPSLGGRRGARGHLPAGEDGLVFRLGLLAGDELSVRVDLARDRGRSTPSPILELRDPAGAGLVRVEAPPGGRRLALADHPVEVTGDHWILLRLAPADSPEDAGFRLRFSVKRDRDVLRTRDSFVPVDGRVVIPFQAAGGMELRGLVRTHFETDLLLEGPSSPQGLLSAQWDARRSRFRLERRVMEGGTGTYRIELDADRFVGCTLRLSAPRKGTLDLR